MKITNAKYLAHSPDVVNPETAKKTIVAIIDGEKMWVPESLDNIHYAEIMRQVDAGELTIEAAD